MNGSNETAPQVVWAWEAQHALELSRGYLAQAGAVLEQHDRNDLHGDLRRTVYGHLMAAADAYERYSDDCRERAFEEQEARRGRYDEQAQESRPRPVPNTVGPVDIAEAVTAEGYHICTARNCACRSGGAA